MKKLIIGLLCFIGGTFLIFLILAYGYINRDFGSTMPKEFPDDVPVIEGKVISCTTSLSRNWKGVAYTVDVESGQSFQETVDFYKAKLDKDAFKGDLGKRNGNNKLATANTTINGKKVLLEILDKDKSVQVTLKVHMGHF